MLRKLLGGVTFLSLKGITRAIVINKYIKHNRYVIIATDEPWRKSKEYCHPNLVV
jgi:hypothetical protein